MFLLHRHVADPFMWLSDYPEDQVDRNAVASVKQDLGWVNGRLPAGPRGPLLFDAPDEEVLKRVTGLLVDFSWWLETCSDEDVDEWVAGNLQEGTACLIAEMADEQRSRLLEILDELAVAEQHDSRRYEMRFFPFAVGLIETEPDEAKPLHRRWVRPQDRIAGQVVGE
ncbi:hypothetical protein [Paractinoplanes hotanensis]|uniref:Uncharacterized protein n=1 Tax=Paractinoplanes hotanensis TaxID=2906497 RepID=A0ABT0XS26_9ACTN|nr:hypothetical protein [Actinoplanes hotanensis]MCM4076574.1 hypothetical protein [Actinoplanes hotanensis]